MLLKMLESSTYFETLGTTQKTIFSALAEAFESTDDNLLRTPAELTKFLQIGNKEQWRDFLNNETVKAYIKGQMADLATVAQRKAFASVSSFAAAGDVQAAKQVNEISGILNSGDSNKVIVLHRIDRPTVTTI